MLKTITKPFMPVEDENKNRIKIFSIAILMSFLVFLPFLIYDKGIFLFIGDYNDQQIPFYRLAHDAIRKGDFGLNWYTDLGSNFIASYSFYLLGSPFFWLTIPFPNSFVPYLMTPLLILKFATAALTSYIFIRRFTKTPHAAFFGALLYSFSGYSIYNVFYNHFHEIIALFPLMLIGLENLITNKKKGIFAVAVALNLIANFYFFVPECVLLFLYFIFRCFTKKFKISIKNFLFLALEFSIGIAMGFILFLPSALMVLKNPRVGGILLGFDALFYPIVQNYALILHSLFFPPDMPSLNNFLPGAVNMRWESVAAYMPMVSLTGVITYLKNAKNSWLKKLLICLFVFMFVPFLNSAFNGFINRYYARWFFGLTLFLALATVIAFEKYRNNFKSAIRLNLFILFCFCTIGIIPKKVNEKLVFFNLPNHKITFWIFSFIAISGVVLTAIILFFNRSVKNSPPTLYKTAFFVFSFFTVLYSITLLSWCKYKSGSGAYEKFVEKGINCDLKLNDNSFFRMDFFPENWHGNIGMYLKIPTIQAFQSTVPASIMSFYKNFGIPRDVRSSIPSGGFDALRNILSVKYIIIPTNFTKEFEPKLPKGFEFFKKENEYNIYKNKNFINVGFLVEKYIEEENFQKINNNIRDRVLTKAVILSKDQIKKYKNILTPISPQEIEKIIQNEEEVTKQLQTLQKNSSQIFKPNSYGFDAKINLKKDGLLLFSVPYETGFSATVNNKKVEIEEVDNGLMAIRCKKGENNIKFSYKTPGLKISILVSLVGIALFLIYISLTKYIPLSNFTKKQKNYLRYIPSTKS